MIFQLNCDIEIKTKSSTAMINNKNMFYFVVYFIVTFWRYLQSVN